LYGFITSGSGRFPQPRVHIPPPIGFFTMALQGNLKTGVFTARLKLTVNVTG
jgi:hypothetical protein